MKLGLIAGNGRFPFLLLGATTRENSGPKIYHYASRELSSL